VCVLYVGQEINGSCSSIMAAGYSRIMAANFQQNLVKVESQYFNLLSLCMLPNKIFSYDFAVTTEFAVINVADDSTGAFDQPNPLPFKFKLHCSHLERCFS